MMAIELLDHSIPQQIIKSATWSAEIPSGEGIRIQTGTLQVPVNQLLEVVPQGKKWNIKLYITITETDA